MDYRGSVETADGISLSRKTSARVYVSVSIYTFLETRDLYGLLNVAEEGSLHTRAV